MPHALYWEPAGDPGRKLPDDQETDSAVALRQLNETFGPATQKLRPVELNRTNIFTLRQMGGDSSLFGALADLLEKNGAIRVWGRDR